MLDQRQDRQVSRAHQVLNKTSKQNQIRGKSTQQQKQPQGHQRLTQQKTNEVRTSNKLSFSRHDISGLTIAVAATIIRLKCAVAEADKTKYRSKGWT